MRNISTKPLPSDCDIVLTGDDHEGLIGQATERLQAMIDYVASNKAVFLCKMGDAIEARCTDHKYFDSDTSSQPIPLRQAENCIELHKPIADKILVWLQGNHEYGLNRFGDIAAYMAKQIGCQYGTYTARVTLQSRRGPMFRMFLTHGIGCNLKSAAKDYEQQIANMKATLKARLANKSGDCSLMACGDTHKLLVVNPAPRLFLTGEAKGGKVHSRYLPPSQSLERWIEPDRRWYVNTGSWNRLYTEGITGYAERFGCDPIELGYAVAEVRGGKLVNVRKVVIT